MFFAAGVDFKLAGVASVVLIAVGLRGSYRTHCLWEAIIVQNTTSGSTAPSFFLSFGVMAVAREGM